MERHITATEANQRFSEMLRDVQGGESFVVTSRGKPVAKLVPIDEATALADQSKKISDFLDYVETLPITDAGPWKREDLYDR